MITASEAGARKKVGSIMDHGEGGGRRNGKEGGDASIPLLVRTICT